MGDGLRTTDSDMVEQREGKEASGPDLKLPDAGVVNIDEAECAKRMAEDGAIARLKKRLERIEENHQADIAEWQERIEEAEADMKAAKKRRAQANLEIKSARLAIARFKDYQRLKPVSISRLENQIKDRGKWIKAKMIAQASKAVQLAAIARYRAR